MALRASKILQASGVFHRFSKQSWPSRSLQMVRISPLQSCCEGMQKWVEGIRLASSEVARRLTRGLQVLLMNPWEAEVKVWLGAPTNPMPQTIANFGLLTLGIPYPPYWGWSFATLPGPRRGLCTEFEGGLGPRMDERIRGVGLLMAWTNLLTLDFGVECGLWHVRIVDSNSRAQPW